VPLAAIGWLPPWLAGLGMACSSLAVVLNALRLVDRTPRMPAAAHGPAAAAGWSAA
jgi:Cu2+-exporting ATPase